MVGRQNGRTPESKSKFWCVVPGCNSDSRKQNNILKYPWMENVQFEPFPTKKREPKLRAKWISMIRRPLGYEPRYHHRVCSRHFIGNCRSENQNIPELFPWNNYKIQTSERSVESIAKRERLSVVTNSNCTSSSTMTISTLECDKNQIEHQGLDQTFEDTAASPPPSLPTYVSVPGQEMKIGVVKCETVETSIVLDDSDNSDIICTSQVMNSQLQKAIPDHNYFTKIDKVNDAQLHVCDQGTQTDLTTDNLNKIIEENKHLQNTLNDKDTLLRNLFVEKVTKDDKSINQYTGLPNLEIFNEISKITLEYEPNLKYWLGEHSENQKQYQNTPHGKKPGPARKLSRYQELVLTLVRFRLALPIVVMSDLFGVSHSRISSVFTTWMFYMFFIFKDFITWPSRELVKKYMPRSFRKLFPRTRAIIDCSEIFIQRPKDPSMNARTYSTYKSHNTFKYLVSITPSGAFNFISQIWGGNTSDRYITEHSGFLDKVSAGDEIMADRGFTIRDLLTERHAFLNIPPFTRKCTWGKGKYLTTSQIKMTRQIANLRIHVERAISRLKSFKLIGQTLPWSIKPLIHPMTVVGAFFCNLKKPLVTK